METYFNVVNIIPFGILTIILGVMLYYLTLTPKIYKNEKNETIYEAIYEVEGKE